MVAKLINQSEFWNITVFIRMCIIKIISAYIAIDSLMIVNFIEYYNTDKFERENNQQNENHILFGNFSFIQHIHTHTYIMYHYILFKVNELRKCEFVWVLRRTVHVITRVTCSYYKYQIFVTQMASSRPLRI